MTHEFPIVARAFGNWGEWGGLRVKGRLRGKGAVPTSISSALSFSRTGMPNAGT